MDELWPYRTRPENVDVSRSKPKYDSTYACAAVTWKLHSALYTPPYERSLILHNLHVTVAANQQRRNTQGRARYLIILTPASFQKFS